MLFSAKYSLSLSAGWSHTGSSYNKPSFCVFVGGCSYAIRSLWMMDAVRYNGSLNESETALWAHAHGQRLVRCFQHIFLLCGYGNINVNTCTISLSLHFITSAHLMLSRPHRCSLIPFKVFHWCGKPRSLTFSHRVSYSLSPWPLASFTTHINTQLPPGNAVPDPRHHLKVANLSPW